LKITPTSNTFLSSKKSYDDRWERYLKNEEYLPKKEKKESEEKDLKPSKDPRIIGYA